MSEPMTPAQLAVLATMRTLTSAAPTAQWVFDVQAAMRAVLDVFGQHAPSIVPSVQPPTREQIAEAIETATRQWWFDDQGPEEQGHEYLARFVQRAVLALFQQPTPSAEPTDGPTVLDLARRHCETFTGASTCADDPDRSAGSPYGATGYCYPCLIRNALTQQSAPVAEPVSIADMAPRTTFTEVSTWTVHWDVCVGLYARRATGQAVERPLDTFDPSTIRDVTPPPATPKETP